MQRSAAVELELQPFHARHAELVLSWVRSREEADRWASAGARELRPELLREWHADADVHPYRQARGRAIGRALGGWNHPSPPTGRGAV